LNPNTKLWGGRFTQATDKAAERFSASIHYDSRLYKHDIEGSIAHAKMLAVSGIITADEARRIESGLNTILSQIESGEFVFRPELEDIHMNIESKLTELIGPAGAKLHTARSRNDQVVNDVRMYLRDEVNDITDLIIRLQKSFLEKAKEYKSAVMPGFTHLQHAQPVLVAHHLLAYVCMLDRDRERFFDSLKRINVMALGSCALAGTPLPINRDYTKELLKFDTVSINSIDAVSDRDFIAEFLADCAILGAHLSRLAEELVLWTSPEFRFVILPDAYCTGSSIMPQKKNPDMAELSRGKTGRLYGNLMSILTTLKGLPLSYNRDLQEDKEPLFDSIDTIKGILTVCDGMVSAMRFNVARLEDMAGADFILATEIADYLVLKNVPFRSAHEISGKIVGYCVKNKKDFCDLDMNQWKSFSDKFEDDIKSRLTVMNSIKNKISKGSTSYNEVENQIDYWFLKINKLVSDITENIQ